MTDVTDNSVGLSWRPPENDGGSFVKNYIVEKFDPEVGKWLRAAVTRSPHCTVENLIPNRPYQFRVIAENAHGTGQPSEPSQSVQTTGKNSDEKDEFNNKHFLF